MIQNNPCTLCKISKETRRVLDCTRFQLHNAVQELKMSVLKTVCCYYYCPIQDQYEQLEKETTKLETLVDKEEAQRLLKITKAQYNCYDHKQELNYLIILNQLILKGQDTSKIKSLQDINILLWDVI